MTSPVIPTVCLTGRPESSDASAVAIVMPALGPSFGIAPAGTWTWNERSSNADSSMPSSLGVRAHVGERDARRLLHHVAELPGEDEPVLLAGHRGGLDEEDVAARAGHGQAGRHPGDRGPLGRLLEELLPAERVADDVQVDRHRRLDLPGGDPRRGLAQHLAELALELADAGLARVLAHDRA